MPTPEIILLLATIALLVRVVAPGLLPQLPTRVIVIATMAALVLDLVVGGPRWQLIPLYLIVVCLLLAGLKRKPSHLIWRVLGATVCGMLLLASVFLAEVLPIPTLPAPDGPYAAGTFFSALTDSTRVETFAPPARRELAVEVWYPSPRTGETDVYPRLPLWSELYAGPLDWLGFFTGYLGRVKTHSYVGAPIAQVATPFPVLLYDSGLGWTSQNTLLMEHLASHGYVVVSVSHPYDQLKVQLPKVGTILIHAGDAAEKARFTSAMYQTFQHVWFEMAGLPNGPQRTQVAVAYMSLCDAVAGSSDPSQRKALIGKALQAANVSPIEEREGVVRLDTFCRVLNDSKNREVARDEADLAFVADHLSELPAPISGFAKSLDLGRVGAFGHSDGGAIAGEFCKVDALCKAGLNIDGAQFGSHWKTPPRAPFAMIYSASQAGLNDFAFPHGPYDHLDYVVADAGHLDFLDFGLVAPLLKVLAQGPLSFGPIRPEEVNAITNGTVLMFFDHYLKGEPAGPSQPAGFRHLTVSPERALRP